MFFTGKGGVGKSTMAMSRAINLALKGSRVLFVELGNKSFVETLLELPSVTYKPLKIKDNLSISLLDTEGCLRDYVLYFIKSEALFKIFFENKVTKSLVDIAPALSELAILGKLTSSFRNHGPGLDFDCVVIDGYSTGHFLSLLAAPSAMAEAIDFGPMAEQSRSIDKVLKNHQFCEYNIVLTAEEMPLIEGVELYESLLKNFNIKSKFIINKFLPSNIDINPSKDMSLFEKTYLHKLNQQRQSIEQLKKLTEKIMITPFILNLNPLQMYEKISEGMYEV